MKISRLFLIFFILGAASCNSDTQSNTSSYETKKMSLEDQEKMTPLNFLHIEGQYRTNLIGQFVIEGKVSNSATIATYKDVEVEISYISKTGAVINKGSEIIYEFVKPNNAIPYKFKKDAPNGTASVSLDIINAISN